MADHSKPSAGNPVKGADKAAERVKNLDDALAETGDTPENVLQEAAREHQDTYIVKSDLEDADQRSIPGTREQP